jgi:hypothetical protein
MAARWRRQMRRAARVERWRRRLLEHRFSVTQTVLGMVATVLGLWLLWPAEHGPRINHRGIWQDSFKQAAPVAEAPTRGPAIAERRLPERPRSATPAPAVTPPAEDTPALARAPEEARPSEVEDYRAALEAGDAAIAARPPRTPAAPPPAQPPALALPAPQLDRDRDELPAWLRHAAETDPADQRPAVAIVIDDLGMSPAGTAAVAALPAPLTLAFLPYARDLPRQTAAARAAGHELLVHMPMEPVGGQWPGPDALLSSLSEPDFALRLEKSLQSFSGFVGINNHMGSRLTADHHWMDVVMRALRQRDLLFLDSRTTPSSVADAAARRQGVPSAVRDVFLDNENSLPAVQAQLGLVERVARQAGAAIAIGHPYGATLEALRGWLPSLEQRGFALVPVSALVARRACRDGLLVSAAACGHAVQAQRPVEPAEARVN